MIELYNSRLNEIKGKKRFKAEYEEYLAKIEDSKKNLKFHEKDLIKNGIETEEKFKLVDAIVSGEILKFLS